MAAKELLWWKETIPRPYLTLRKAAEEQSKRVPRVKVARYLEMLKEARGDKREEKAVTSFLHDMGVLKYFGHELGVDHSKEDRDSAMYSVEDTVFIDPVWMIDVLKGVMRHDWQHLLDFIQQDMIKSKKIKKLLHLGIIDEDVFETCGPSETATSGAMRRQPRHQDRKR